MASSKWNKELAGFMARGTHVKGRKTRAPNRLVAARDWRCSEVIVLYTKCGFPWDTGWGGLP